MTPDQILKLWRPTAHYGRLLTEGRNRPAPSIGSPTLIWHLSVSRKRVPYEPKPTTKAKSTVAKSTTKEESPPNNIDVYLAHNSGFFREVSAFLRKLQDMGLVSSSTTQDLTLKPIPIPGANNKPGEDPFQIFETYLPQSMNFELWWQDGANSKNPNRRFDPRRSTKEEIDGATRVFVQFQSFHDHITCTFYMDVAQKYNGSQILDADELAESGVRKRKIGEYLHTIRRASLGQVRSGAINAPMRIAANSADIPPDLRVDPAELRAAVNYLYNDIWEEFKGAFGFEL